MQAGSSDLPGWEITGQAIDHLYEPTFEASDGGRSLDLNNLDSSGVQQTFVTTVAQLYQVAFDMASNPGGAPTIKSIEASAAGQSEQFSFDSSGKTFTNMGWLRKEFTFVATSPSTTLHIRSTSPGGFGPALDNVVVTAVPEPTTGVLALIGATALAAGRCRRRAGR